MTNDLVRETEICTPEWTRRRFLKTGALGLALLGTAAACGTSSTAGTAASTKGGSSRGTPKRGGTLRVGATGGGSTDTLDPQNWATNADQLRIQQLYDPLVWMADDGTAQLVLAESITPNADATRWTIKIPAGLTTHQGKPFTAADILFSLKRIVKNSFPGATVLGPVDFTKSKAVDATTTLLAYSKPFGYLIEALSFPFFYMVPRGFDLKKPDGTGPFKFSSFTAGVQSTFVRNENYWQHGKPYLDTVVTLDFADESTQVNGLQSGQVDIVNGLSASSIPAIQNAGLKLNINKSGTWIPFTLDCSAKPFSDVRVRQAFRLIPNRQQMLEQVYSGYGSLGNDVFSPYDPAFPKNLTQREQDIPQAKSLLKAAGYDSLGVTLVTAPAAGGEISLAQVFATQAKEAGVNVVLQQQTVGDFYAKYYKKVPFGMDYGTNQLFLVNAGQLMIGSASFFNANHFNDAEYNALYAKAVSTTNTPTRTDLIHQMSQIDYERGAYIVPIFSPVIEAFSAKVGGVAKSVTGVSPGNADFKNFWIS